jgi:hypothetical protein
MPWRSCGSATPVQAEATDVSSCLQFRTDANLIGQDAEPYSVTPGTAVREESIEVASGGLLLLPRPICA